MPIDYYPNATKPELVTLLESVQRRATIGQTYMTTNSGDQQMRSFTGASPVRVEIRNILFSLFLKDPDAFENPYSQRVRRTSPDYSSSQ